jgi:hypothetical protein
MQANSAAPGELQLPVTSLVAIGRLANSAAKARAALLHWRAIACSALM